MKSPNKEHEFVNTNLQITCYELTKLVQSNTSRLYQCEQYSGNTNIEIKRVQILPEECMIRLFWKLGEATNAAIRAADVDVYHRVPLARKPSEKEYHRTVHP